MSRFGQDPEKFFDSVYRGEAPWEIGAPQPALLGLFNDFPPAGPVLDVGCGTGDLAIYLAGRGLSVTGVDFVEAAIDRAISKTRDLPAEVAERLEFRVADALMPSRLWKLFGAAVDSGFHHLFDPPRCDAFAADLRHALLPEGRYYVLAFAVEYDSPDVPRKITEEELRARFSAANGWRVLELREEEFQTQLGPVPAIAGAFERI